MKPEEIKTIEEWYDVKISEFIEEFEDYYRKNANLALYKENLDIVKKELNNTTEFEDQYKNKISKEELLFLKEVDSHITKPGGMAALLGMGAQDYWLNPFMAYNIGNRTLYKTKNYIDVTNKISKTESLIEFSKLTMEEYVEQKLRCKLSNSETYAKQLNWLYQKIHNYIEDLVEYIDDCECCNYDILEYQKSVEERNNKIKEELGKSTTIEEIQKIYNDGIAEITQKWSKYGYTERLTADEIISRHFLENYQHLNVRFLLLIVMLLLSIFFLYYIDIL